MSSLADRLEVNLDRVSAKSGPVGRLSLSLECVQMILNELGPLSDDAAIPANVRFDSSLARVTVKQWQYAVNLSFKNVGHLRQQLLENKKELLSELCNAIADYEAAIADVAADLVTLRAQL